MFNTDESSAQLETMRWMIYFLVHKLGGYAEVNFTEMNNFFTKNKVTCKVADTPLGIAFKTEVDAEATSEDAVKALGGYED